MERKIYRLILFLLLAVMFYSPCSGNRSVIYRAYVTNRMDIWKNVMDRMESGMPGTNDQIIELVNYQYGYIGYCIGYKKREEAKRYLELAEKNIILLEQRNYDRSTIDAYKCAFYGFKIGLNKLSAPINGPKSLELARSSLDHGKDNYFAHVQYGNIMFYMPATFGGSKKEGIEYFLRAKEILERDPSDIADNWNYMSLLLVIGQSYTYLDDLNSAKAVYEKILRLEPGFLYVKDELYPQLLKKMEN